MKKALKTFGRKMTGKEPISSDGEFKIICVGILVVHIILLVLFTLFSAFFMEIYNLIAIAFYMYLISEVKKGKTLVPCVMAMVEILITVTLGVFFTGWQTSFTIYFFCTVPSVYFLVMNTEKMKGKLLVPIIFSFIAFGLTVGEYIFSLSVPAQNPLSKSGIITFHVFNDFVGFLFIAFTCHTFILQMIGSADSMMTKNKNLEHTASVDPLTSLYNRRHMETMLDVAMEKAKTKGTLFSLIMGDIDNFKRINDTYGHDCGDQALLHVSEVMHRCVREGDVICRWGGEEFLLLIQGNQETAVTVGERIRSCIERESIEYQGQVIAFTITFGVTTYVPGYSMETLIRQADDHLYIGKTTGKNKVVV